MEGFGENTLFAYAGFTYVHEIFESHVPYLLSKSMLLRNEHLEIIEILSIVYT